MPATFHCCYDILPFSYSRLEFYLGIFPFFSPSCLLQSLTGELRLINLARKLFYGVKRVVKFKTECKNHFLSKFFHENLGHCGLLKLLRYGSLSAL